MKSYDHSLRDCMKEIEEVLKKYDCAAFISLNSKTHAEFKLCIEHMSWSNARFLKEGEAFHIKIHQKSNKENTEATVAALYSMREMSALAFQQTNQIAQIIEQSVKVEHVAFGGGITNEDRE
jgi:hypothetical protein